MRNRGDYTPTPLKGAQSRFGGAGVAFEEHFVQPQHPKLRVVYGGPVRIGDKYRELGVGLRGSWRF
jgi:hypothetical protein